MSFAPGLSTYTAASVNVLANGGIGAKEENTETDLKAWISNRFRHLPGASTPSVHYSPSSSWTPSVPSGSPGAVLVPPGIHSLARAENTKETDREIDACIRDLLKLTPCTGAPLEAPEVLGPFSDSAAEQQTQGQLIHEWRQARSRCDMLGRRLELEKDLSRRLEAEMNRLRRELPRTSEAPEQLRGQASAYAEEQAGSCDPQFGGHQMLHALRGISSRPRASTPPPLLQVASPSRYRQIPTDHKHDHCVVPGHAAPAERQADAARSSRSRSQQGLQARARSTSPSKPDCDEVDMAWCQVMQALPRDLPHDWTIIKERPGVYRLPGHSTAVLARLSHQGLQVRVGGGWMPAGRFLLKNWPADLGAGGGGAVSPKHHLSPAALVRAVPTPQCSPASYGGSTSCTAALGRSPSLDRLLAPTESWARRVDARKELLDAARERCRRNSPGPDRAGSPGRSCSWRSVAG
mmetsp:Transcript_90379/g.179854  ORF Transcript_90379/g.179854 Transcript_90379/m.179854 type:complete len:464 (-) Transcript_90379:104-1495(-)